MSQINADADPDPDPGTLKAELDVSSLFDMYNTYQVPGRYKVPNNTKTQVPR
jgi:hypothetical protein